MALKEVLAKKIDEWRPRIVKLLKEHGKDKVDEVTISQLYGGMRGIKSLTTDISYLDPMEGIRFRGYTIPECLEKLPKPPGKDMPYDEGHFYLLLTGDMPTEENVAEVKAEWSTRYELPQYVIDILRAFPRDARAMSMFSAAVVALQRESKFFKTYDEGKLGKMTAWDPMYEDVMDLMPKMATIGAYIYRMKYKDDTPIAPDPDLDYGSNFAYMAGVPEPYDDVSRMYFMLHSDHESGNVSAHTAHLVASGLADIYYSVSAMIDGLAGPLHGLANQETLKWIQGMMEKLNYQEPTPELLKKFCWDLLNSGQVIPGYGHAVLRKTDPRYMAQREFAMKHLPDDLTFKYVSGLFEVVPDILTEQGKAKNPWPNVDAHSGCIQWYYGVQEYEFYTCLFNIGRAFGVCPNIIWDRALGQALERPKSLTTPMLEKIAGIK